MGDPGCYGLPKNERDFRPNRARSRPRHLPLLSRFRLLCPLISGDGYRRHGGKYYPSRGVGVVAAATTVAVATPMYRRRSEERTRSGRKRDGRARKTRTRRRDGGGVNSRGIWRGGKKFTGLAHCAGSGARYRAAARPPTGTRPTEFLYVYPPARARVTVTAVERRRVALSRARARASSSPPCPHVPRARDRCNARAIE